MIYNNLCIQTYEVVTMKATAFIFGMICIFAAAGVKDSASFWWIPGLGFPGLVLVWWSVSHLPAPKIFHE